MKIAVFLHLAGVVVWVGGMFFAYLALRPAASFLDPAQRLPLWRDTLRRFFGWVWVSVALILASGLWMVFQLGGFRVAPLNVHAMFIIGLIMMMVFTYVYVAPFSRLTAAVSARDWQAGGAALGTIRKLVAVNLILGFVTIAMAILGAALRS